MDIGATSAGSCVDDMAVEGRESPRWVTAVTGSLLPLVLHLCPAPPLSVRHGGNGEGVSTVWCF